MMMEAERPKPRPRHRVTNRVEEREEDSSNVDQLEKVLADLPVASHDLGQTVQEENGNALVVDDEQTKVIENEKEEQVQGSVLQPEAKEEEAMSEVPVPVFRDAAVVPMSPLVMPSAVVEMPLSSLIPQPIVLDSHLPRFIDLYPSLPTEMPISIGNPLIAYCERTDSIGNPLIAYCERTDSMGNPLIAYCERTDSIGNPLIAYCERTDHGLLTEQQLCHFYHNEAVEALEDFVDSFIQSENSGRHGFLEPLLLRYKAICERLDQAMLERIEVEKECCSCQNQIWAVNTSTVSQQGRCGCDKAATGTARFQTAELRSEALTRLARCLDRSRQCELDSLLCHQIASRSLALQIQWIVVNEVTRFLIDHRLNASSSPSIVFCGGDMGSRLRLRSMLSDLFHCLRIPHLPSQFEKSVEQWIIELGSVLLRAATPIDQQLILCHLLRCAGSLQWAVGLLQSFVDCQQLRPVIDHVLAMVALLLAPVRAREEFLRSTVQYMEQDAAWTMISLENDEDEMSPIALQETDLISFLNQFSTEHLYANALQHFATLNKTNLTSQVLSLFAFQLTLTKVLHDGISTYGRPQFRQFCKQIGYTLRQSVRHLASFWSTTQALVLSSDVAMLQAEFDRVLLLVVKCIIDAHKLGLWQCLVDLPYYCASELCRIRCEYLIISTGSPSVVEIYNQTQNELQKAVRSDPLMDRVMQVGDADGPFLLSALASIRAHSESDSEWFLSQLMTTCFIDTNTRDRMVKAGAEAIALLIEHRPEALSGLLKLIDRNIDSLDQYAVDILNTADLSRCRPTGTDIGSVLGKWLVQRSVEHPASRIARRVLTSLNWAPLPENRGLWLSSEVHWECAETVVRAHRAQCQTRNGLLAKSVSKMAKLAGGRVPDHEHQFDVFCWDLILRLKLSPSPSPSPSSKENAGTPPSDLIGLYVHIIRYCLNRVSEFQANGLGYLTQLLAAGCFAAAVKIIFVLVEKFAGEMDDLLKNASFVENVSQTVHADQSSYAMQWISGADKFPGPVLKLFAGAVNYELIYVPNGSASCCAMAKLCSIDKNWNIDRYALHLLEQIARSTFISGDSSAFAGLIDFFLKHYQGVLSQNKETTRGVLSWLAGDQPPPPIIAKEFFAQFPWLSFVLLSAEQNAFPLYNEALVETLSNKPSKSLEQSAKKAASKSGINLGVDRLVVSRWLQLCNCLSPKHPVFVLSSQLLIRFLFRRYTYNRNQICHSQRYRQCQTLQADWDQLQNSLETAVRETEGPSRELNRALLSWLFIDNVNLGNTKFQAFGDLPLDYLLQLQIGGDEHPWSDWIDTNGVVKEGDNSAQLFINICKLRSIVDETNQRSTMPKTVTALLNSLRSHSVAIPAPDVPLHPNLPSKIDVSMADCLNNHFLMHKFAPQLLALLDMGRRFISSRDMVMCKDQELLSLLPRLYSAQQTSIPLVLRCSAILSKCPRPNTVTVLVTASQLSPAIDAQMTENRQKRCHDITSVQSGLQDVVAVHTAMLEEMCRAMAMLEAHGELQETKIQEAGLALFHHLVRSIGLADLLFPAAHEAFDHCLRQLGQRFVAGRAGEQESLVRIILAGSHLGHLLVAFFTPHCLNSTALMQLYARLSIAVRQPTSAAAAFQLMQRVELIAEGRFSTTQLSSLLPIAFENLVAVAAQPLDDPLLRLCAEHFLHATFQHFPDNFVHGFRLALQGGDTKSTPVDIFNQFIARLGAKHVLPLDQTPPGSGLSISAVTALEACVLLSDQLTRSRREFGPRLFTVWKDYLGPVCHLAHFFMSRAFTLTFDSQAAVSRMECELNRCFEQVMAVWAPLLEPVGNGVAAWNPSDGEVAMTVLTSFVAIMDHLHSLYDTYLPPGCRNVEALMWQCYADRLATLSRSSGHVYQLMETALIRLPWQQFWPTLGDLHGMRRLMAEGAPECSPLVTQIIVRIPWNELIAHQSQQPMDANRAFFALLFSLLARCCCRPVNYALCKASFPVMLQSLNGCLWYLLPVEALRPDVSFIVSSYPSTSLKEPDHVLSALFRLMQKILAFSPSDSMPDSASKRALFLRMQLEMMLKNGDRQWAAEHYKALIDQSDAIIASRDGEIDPDQACIAQELCACWGQISDEKLGEALVKQAIDWIRHHHDSALLLLIMRTVAGSVKANQLPTALRVVEVVIGSYFRGSGSREWSRIDQWIVLPQEPSRKWLYTIPSSENGVTPHLLTMNALLNVVLQSSTNDERSWLVGTVDYLTAVKIKYLTDEAASLLILHKILLMLQRQFIRSPSDSALHAIVRRLIEWLNRAHTDDRSAIMALISKRPAFSPRMRLVCQLIELFLVQNSLGEGQSPRLQPETPVVNSRIQTVRELAGQKAMAPFASTIKLALPFFEDVRRFHLGHGSQLLAIIASSLFEEKYLHSLGNG